MPQIQHDSEGKPDDIIFGIDEEFQKKVGRGWMSQVSSPLYHVAPTMISVIPLTLPSAGHLALGPGIRTCFNL